MLSPIRDPVKTRNRFEGLLEGAIKMYSNNNPDESIDDADTISKDPKQMKSKEFRGKSAIPYRSISL